MFFPQKENNSLILLINDTLRYGSACAFCHLLKVLYVSVVQKGREESCQIMRKKKKAFDVMTKRITDDARERESAWFLVV